MNEATLPVNVATGYNESEIVVHGLQLWPMQDEWCPFNYDYDDAVYAALSLRDRSTKWLWRFIQEKLTNQHDRYVMMTLFDLISVCESAAKKDPDGECKWPSEPETADDPFPY